MHIPGLETTPTSTNHHTGSAERTLIGVSLPTENCSSKLVDEHIMEVITAESTNIHGEKSTSTQVKRQAKTTILIAGK